MRTRKRPVAGSILKLKRAADYGTQFAYVPVTSRAAAIKGAKLKIVVVRRDGKWEIFQRH